MSVIRPSDPSDPSVTSHHITSHHIIQHIVAAANLLTGWLADYPGVPGLQVPDQLVSISIIYSSDGRELSCQEGRAGAVLVWPSPGRFRVILYF